MAGLLRGAISGALATVPMTVAMDAMHQNLPNDEQYPSPPEQIAAIVERRIVGTKLPEPAHKSVAMTSHFGYGTLVGALYGPVSRLIPLPPALRGMAYAMGVWGASYLGVLPALDLFPPATEDTPNRNAMMIAAHLIWGSALGILAD